MTLKQKSPFVVLAVLDGWGIAPKTAGNAIASANTPNMDKFWSLYPHTQLSASGESVGLPHGEAGNTEVGHINLGAGRVVYQDLTRINLSIAEGSFFKNKALLGAIEHARKNNSNLHYMGLLGAGGVHSSIEHLYALIQLASRAEFDRLFLHIFTDGRDSPARSALMFFKDLEQILTSTKIGKIATIIGRYWAMDRDLRWERTKKAYEALTAGIGEKMDSTQIAIEKSYEKAINDEFIEPTIILENGEPLPRICDNDAVVFFNFRIDRPRQLSKAFVAEDFTEAAKITDFNPHAFKHDESSKLKAATANVFDRGPKLKNLYFATMTEFSNLLVEDGAKVAYPPEKVKLPLGEIVSNAGLKQLRVSESEKEHFVTHYFNGQNDVIYQKEERLIVPSPAAATYDLVPEMSAEKITNVLLEELREGSPYSFVLVNFANADMVGHSGNIGPTSKACEVVDECIGKLASFILTFGGSLLITSDHGNAEEMINSQNGQVDTEHSTNPVPFIAVSKQFEGKNEVLPSGILADVAPTILYLLGIPVPSAMTGRNLLENLV